MGMRVSTHDVLKMAIFTLEGCQEVISFSSLNESSFRTGFQNRFTIIVDMGPDRKRKVTDRGETRPTPSTFTGCKGTSLDPKISAEDSPVALQVFLTLCPATESFEVDPATCDVPRS